MNQSQLEQARALKASGKSFRQIATELGVSLVSVWRTLRSRESEEHIPSSEGEGHNLEPHPTTSTTAPQPSALIAARIGETKAQLSAIDRELADMPRLKDELLAAAVLDHVALSDLEGRESDLEKEADRLLQRLPFLERQQEAAETAEAQNRLDEIPIEAEKLHAQLPALMERHRELEAALVEQASKIAAVHRQHRELGSEQHYYLNRYRGVTRSRLVEIEEPPKAITLSNEIHRLFYEAYAEESSWAKKLRQWEAGGRKRPC